MVDKFMRSSDNPSVPSLYSLIILLVVPWLAVGVLPQDALAQPPVKSFLVSYFASHNMAEPQQSEAAATYISITNISDNQCATKVEWRNKSGALACTSETNTTVDPRLVAGGTLTHCSRAFEPFSPIPQCDQPCDSIEPDVLEGSATVFIDTNCEGFVVIDARVYYTSVSAVPTELAPLVNKEIVLSAHSPTIVKLSATGTIE